MPRFMREKMSKSAPKTKPPGFGAKISKALRGRIKGPTKAHHKRKIRETCIRKYGKPFKDQYGTVYNSVGEAARILRADRGWIRYALQHGYTVKGKYRFVYIKRRRDGTKN